VDLDEDIARLQMMCDDESLCDSSTIFNSKLKRSLLLRVDKLKTISNGRDCKIIYV